MSDLFTQQWMQNFQNEWNNEPELSDALAKIDFNTSIGYGFKGDGQAKGYIKVEGGKVTEAGVYDGQELNWDLRADDSSWDKWMSKELGMTGLGMAVTTGKLKFNAGDFKAMVKDPRMATPFVKSFGVMGRA